MRDIDENNYIKRVSIKKPFNDCENKYAIIGTMLFKKGRYFKEGLDDIDDTIKQATNKYMNENDDIGNFIKEYCILDKNSFTYHNDLYTLYKQYTNDYISGKTFSMMMNSKGFELYRKADGRGFKNIKIIDKSNENDKMTDDTL